MGSIKRLSIAIYVAATLTSQIGIASPVKTPVIGYGSSTSVITDKIQEGFISGFHLGFEGSKTSHNRESKLKVEQVRDGSPLGAITSANRLLDSGVSALFGFPGSTDALLVSRIAKKANIITVFPGCNHNGLGDQGPAVFSTGHSGYHEVWAQLEIAEKKLNFQRGLAIINPMAAPSAGLEEIYTSEKTQSKFSKLKIKTTRLLKTMTLDPQVLKEIENGQYDFLIFTPYPEASVKFVDQLLSINSDLPVIAGSAWGTVDSDVMRRFVSGKKAPFLMQTSWLADSAEGQSFRNAFKNRYAKEPTAESAYGYDLGRIAKEVIDRIHGPVTKESFFKAFHSNLCFRNLSIGKLCFPETGGHAVRKIFFLKFTTNGFKKAYEVQPD